MKWRPDEIAAFVRDYTAADGLSLDELVAKYGRNEEALRWRIKTLGIARHPAFVSQLNSERRSGATRAPRWAEDAAEPLGVLDDTWPGCCFEDDPREARRPFRPQFLPIWRAA